MENVNKKRYDEQSLRDLNRVYFGIDAKDVEEINELVNLIEQSRSDEKPQPGDIISYTNEFGDYYPKAMVSVCDERGISAVLNPVSPIAAIKDEQLIINTYRENSTLLPTVQTQLKSKTLRYFHHLKYPPMLLDGGIVFQAEVNEWECRHPKPLYGEFSTANWRKLYFYQYPDSEFKYSGERFSFRTEEDFQKYVKAYKGAVFPGIWPNQVVVWCYSQVLKKISRKDWEEIKAKPISREIGKERYDVKIVLDDYVHQIINYIPVTQ